MKRTIREMVAEQGNNENKILECIFNIDMTCRGLFLLWNDLKSHKLPLKGDVFNAIMRYTYIQFCVIQDEIQTLHNLKKSDPYLLETFYLIELPLAALSKYTGLKRMRNLMLAHLNRAKDGHSFAPWWREIIHLKIPRTVKEVRQIHVWISTINVILVTKYKEKFDKFTDALRPEHDDYFEQIKKLEDDALVNATPFDDMEMEVRRRLEEKGVTQLSIDPIMAEYGFFKPKEILTEDIKRTPAFQQHFQRVAEAECRKRKRVLTPKELDSLMSYAIAEFVGKK